MSNTGDFSNGSVRYPLSKKRNSLIISFTHSSKSITEYKWYLVHFLQDQIIILKKFFSCLEIVIIV